MMKKKNVRREKATPRKKKKRKRTRKTPEFQHPFDGKRYINSEPPRALFVVFNYLSTYIRSLSLSDTLSDGFTPGFAR